MVSNKILKLKEIENEVNKCKKCPLHKTRKNPVSGEGNPDADIVIFQIILLPKKKLKHVLNI